MKSLLLAACIGAALLCACSAPQASVVGEWQMQGKPDPEHLGVGGYRITFNANKTGARTIPSCNDVYHCTDFTYRDLPITWKTDGNTIRITDENGRGLSWTYEIEGKELRFSLLAAAAPGLGGVAGAANFEYHRIK